MQPLVKVLCSSLLFVFDFCVSFLPPEKNKVLYTIVEIGNSKIQNAVKIYHLLISSHSKGQTTFSGTQETAFHSSYSCLWCLSKRAPHPETHLPLMLKSRIWEFRKLLNMTGPSWGRRDDIEILQILLQLLDNLKWHNVSGLFQRTKKGEKADSCNFACDICSICVVLWWKFA